MNRNVVKPENLNLKRRFDRPYCSKLTNKQIHKQIHINEQIIELRLIEDGAFLEARIKEL